jgi:two-component system sensor histidine kinase DegS
MSIQLFDPYVNAIESPQVMQVLSLRRSETDAVDETSRIKREIARDLHDQLAQELYALLRQTEVFAREQQGSVEVREQFGFIQTSLRDTLHDLRNLLAELRGQPSMAEDFIPAVKESLARFEERTRVKASMWISRSWPATLPPETCINVFRIIQEALNNAYKHSGASRVHVALRRAPGGRLVISVRDNGHGIQWYDDLAPAGMGIVGMRERASLLGGVVTIKSRNLGGTTITANLPKEALAWSRKNLPPAS